MREIRETRKVIDAWIRPRLRPHQRIMLVPGLDGNGVNNVSGTMADQDEYLVAKLNGYLEWVKSDKDVVGVIPWHWLDEPSPQTSIIGLGMQSFPKLVAQLNAVGAELRNGSSAGLGRRHADHTAAGFDRPLALKSDDQPARARAPAPLRAKKLGLYMSGFYESTPIMWHGEMLLVETIHDGTPEQPLTPPTPTQPHTYYRIRRHASPTQAVTAVVPGSVGFHFVAALVVADAAAEGGQALWLFGSVDPSCTGPAFPSRQKVFAWWSKDRALKHWNHTMILELPQPLSAWNPSVTKGPSGFVMALATRGLDLKPTAVRTTFAICYECDTDLSSRWSLLSPSSHVYRRDRYTGAPTIRYLPEDKHFYLLTIFANVPFPPRSGDLAAVAASKSNDSYPCCFVTWVSRSPDLSVWEEALPGFNPILPPDNPAAPPGVEHRVQPGSLLALAKGDAGAKHRAQADNYTDINSSDIDFCEVPGNATHGASTYIVYCTGDQRGGPGFNAAAIVAAPQGEWLQSYFARPKLANESPVGVAGPTPGLRQHT